MGLSFIVLVGIAAFTWLYMETTGQKFITCPYCNTKITTVLNKREKLHYCENCKYTFFNR